VIALQVNALPHALFGFDLDVPQLDLEFAVRVLGREFLAKGQDLKPFGVGAHDGWAAFRNSTSTGASHRRRPTTR